ncbi:unnamed protein product [Bemisia tabaci]|uniref:Uncharacterized protein n=1 Tax=Bemisia tabaci TaxID=7038 RepID=A0A9P0EVW1_BEMTA|nr:unnamed protein product [Bemisia tabaci]
MKESRGGNVGQVRDQHRTPPVRKVCNPHFIGVVRNSHHKLSLIVGEVRDQHRTPPVRKVCNPHICTLGRRGTQPATEMDLGFSFKTGVGGGYGKLTPEKDVKSKQPGGSTTPVTERPLLKEGGRPSEVTSGKPRKSGSVPSTAEGLPIKTGEGKGYGKLRPEKDETPKQPAGSTTPISQRPLLKEGGRPSKETSGKPQKPGSVPVTTEGS